MDIRQLRIARQQLIQPGFKRPGEVVAWLGAVQGQEYAGGKWGIGLRLPKSTEKEVEQAIASAVIVRTWAMRGTLHFVAGADLRWLLALLSPHVTLRNQRRYRELELDEATLVRSTSVITHALEGGKRLNRKELLRVLEQSGISTAGQRAPYILQRACLDGFVCQGVYRANHPTYMLVDEALPTGRMFEREEALAELARRYFTSRGPATLRDFVWWSGLPAADARLGLEAVEAGLEKEVFAGRDYWLPASRSLQPKDALAAHLLPAYDEYMVAYKDRSAALDATANERVRLSNGLSPVIAVGGEIVGTWRRVGRKERFGIECTFLRELSPAEQEAVTAAEGRYRAFMSWPG